MKKINIMSHNVNVSKSIENYSSSSFTDSDPEDESKLWCICRTPHNNRFMICCDVCDEWFHGKCVGITRQMGREMENQEYICPNCIEKQKTLIKKDEKRPQLEMFTKSELGMLACGNSYILKTNKKEEVIQESSKPITLDPFIPVKDLASVLNNSSDDATITTKDSRVDKYLISTESATPPPPPPPVERSIAPILWSGEISMCDVAKFQVSLSPLSGSTAMIEFPNKFDVIGRINPDTVWEYLDKIRISNDIVLLKFFSNENETTYSTIISHLEKRKRLGVIKIPSKMVKDFYIMPLTSNKSMPSILKSTTGFDLSADHPDLLLGIIVRNRIPQTSHLSVPTKKVQHTSPFSSNMKIISDDSSMVHPRVHQSSKDKANHVVVIEKTTGQIFSGKNAPTHDKLKQWLTEHPTFEVLRPGTPQAMTFKTKQLKSIAKNMSDKENVVSQPTEIQMNLSFEADKMMYMLPMTQKQVNTTTLKRPISATSLLSPEKSKSETILKTPKLSSTLLQKTTLARTKNKSTTSSSKSVQKEDLHESRSQHVEPEKSPISDQVRDLTGFDSSIPKSNANAQLLHLGYENFDSPDRNIPQSAKEHQLVADETDNNPSSGTKDKSAALDPHGFTESDTIVVVDLTTRDNESLDEVNEIPLDSTRSKKKTQIGMTAQTKIVEPNVIDLTESDDETSNEADGVLRNESVIMYAGKYGIQRSIMTIQNMETDANRQ